MAIMLEKKIKNRNSFFENLTTRDMNTYLFLTHSHVSFS